MNALEVCDINKSFCTRKKTIHAVQNVSFSVADGEVLGLLGMNGAGKSTTIKMCTGLLDPDSGSISVFGKDIVRERTEAKSLLNVSPQETAVGAMLSVRENLELTAMLYGSSKSESAAAAQAIMESMSLLDRARDRAGKLSGGLMRRLSIGMALITKPKLVFLDEPTLGLDILSRRELWKHIRNLKKSTAVVLTTHYLEEAEALCDRIAIMSKGKLVAVGTAEELKNQAQESTFENAFLRLAGEENCINE